MGACVIPGTKPRTNCRSGQSAGTGRTGLRCITAADLPGCPVKHHGERGIVLERQFDSPVMWQIDGFPVGVVEEQGAHPCPTRGTPDTEYCIRNPLCEWEKDARLQSERKKSRIACRSPGDRALNLWITAVA